MPAVPAVVPVVRVAAVPVPVLRRRWISGWRSWYGTGPGQAGDARRAGKPGRGAGCRRGSRWPRRAAAGVVARQLALLAVPASVTGPLRRGAGRVFTGDARHLDYVLPPNLLGQVALVVTSPPYGPSTHGHVTTDHTGVHKRNHRYGDLLDRGNLANIGHHRLLAGFTRILTLTAPYLRPGGRVVITVRPWREHAELIDLPAQIQACARAAGLAPVERCVALLGRVTETGGFVARGSFFQRDFIHRQRARGLPLHILAHEDVIVAQAAHFPGRSAG